MFLSKILLLSCMIIIYIVQKKHLFRYYLQAFSREEILKPYIKDCLKINGKGRIMILKKGEYDKLKNYERKIKPPLITYADFESILVLGNNGK